MKMKDSVFNFSNIVKQYKTVTVYDEEVTCPLCQGRRFAKNPNWNPTEDTDDEYLMCPYCKDGKIKVGERKERVLDPTEYKIVGISVRMTESSSHVFYDIMSIGANKHEYKLNVSEEDLVLAYFA